MNFIKHFLGFMLISSEDERLTSHHVSLYITLFHFWNINHFKNPVSVYRGETMRLARIGSVNTYLKCLKELSEWRYFEYQPSRNPQRGSKVYLYRFDTSADTSSGTSTDTTREQVVIPSINILNNTKQIQTERGKPPTLDNITEFFISKKSTRQEASKFFNHFQSNGWLVGGRAPMQDWQAAAEKWIMNTPNFTKHETKARNLNTATDKNYSEPL